MCSVYLIARYSVESQHSLYPSAPQVRERDCGFEHRETKHDSDYQYLNFGNIHIYAHRLVMQGNVRKRFLVCGNELQCVTGFLGLVCSVGDLRRILLTNRYVVDIA